jgi:hypothetical protein
MTTTIYGLKNCDTCKKATKWLDRFGVAYTFVDYRDHKPAPETLVEWASKAGGLVETAAARAPAADPPPGGDHRRRCVEPGIFRQRLQGALRKIAPRNPVERSLLRCLSSRSR